MLSTTLNWALDISIEKYEEKITAADLTGNIEYGNKERKILLNYISDNNYEEAIDKLFNIVKNPVFFPDRELAYLDLIYLLSINGKYTISNYIINDFKSKTRNIDANVKEWIDYIEIFNISQLATKEYDVINLINNFLNDNPAGIFTEHILYLKGQTLINQNNIDLAIKTYEIIYEMNPSSIYFYQMYPLLKYYYDNTEQYKLTKDIISHYINISSKNENLENEYYWLGQYYDSLNEINNAKKWFEKLAKNSESALYPEAIYWLANYYNKKNSKKASYLFEQLSEFEGYEYVTQSLKD